MKKTLFLLALPLLIETVTSCCNCDDPDTINYSHCTIESINGHFKNQHFESTEADQIPADEFGLALTIRSSSRTCQHPSTSFFPSAYATSPCECVEFNYSARDKVDSIAITALTDFDASIQKGDNMLAYFGIQNGVEYNHITPHSFSYEFNKNYVYESVPFKYAVYLKLLYPPTNDSKQQFEVFVRLTDGRTITTITTPVQLI